MRKSDSTTAQSAVAEINLDTVASNLNIIKTYLPEQTKICAVLKGDAYGFGLEGMAYHLCKLGMVDMLAVGTVFELISAINHSGGDCKVLVIGYVLPDELAGILDDGLIKDTSRMVLSGYNINHLLALDDIAKEHNIKINIHIRIDNMASGMGFSYEEFYAMQDEIFAFEHLNVCGIYSHFYTSYSDDDKKLEAQIKRFDEVINTLSTDIRSRVVVHLMNSGMVFRFRHAAYDMVRLGSAIYGFMEERGLKFGLSVKSVVFAIKYIGESAILGYDDSETDGAKRMIARIMIGSADLYGLLFTSSAKIRIGDGLYPLADSPCMDNICVDITDAFPPVRIHDEAVLIGGEGLTITDIIANGDIDYIHAERISMSTKRLQKRYIGEILCQKGL